MDDITSEYTRHGTVFPVTDLFSADRLDAIEQLCSTLVVGRPEELRAEDLLNLHTSHPGGPTRVCRRFKARYCSSTQTKSY
eukprot:5541050-Amphidinium_carterae.1